MVPERTTDIPNADDLDFMKIKLKVGDHVVAGDLTHDLHIPEDPEDLLREIGRYPSLYFYYTSVAEQAKREEAVIRRQFEHWQAETVIKLRRELVNEGLKVTEAVVQSEFLMRYYDELENWNDQLDRAQYRKNILSNAAKSMLEKGSAAVNVLSYKKQQLIDSGRQ